MQRPVHRTALLALTIATFLAFCSTVAVGATVDVAIGDGGLFFSPSSVTIQPGDTVRWTFSSGGHSTTSGSTWDAQQPVGFWNSQPGSCLQPYVPERWNVSELPHTARRMLRHGRHGQGGSCDAHAHAHTYTAADGWSSDRHNQSRNLDREFFSQTEGR